MRNDERIESGPVTNSERAPRILRCLLDRLRGYFAELLRVTERDRAKSQVFQSAELVNLNCWLKVFFSIAFATLGLIVRSPAVVIVRC